jgi:hypothetical protein
MEVHHTHSSGKKWHHHLWEFLMLFLAVFCGFLAEYYLEQTIEHHKEEQFMTSLVEDLSLDTAEIKLRISQADETKKFSDSAIAFLNSYKPASTIPAYFGNQLIAAQQRLRLINTDRTSTQLKNSGGMRLIRNKKVVDHILAYWKQVEESQSSLDRYLDIRNAGRDLTFKLFKIAISYADSVPVKNTTNLDVIDEDPKKWYELTNLISVSRQIAKGEYSNNLQKQYDSALELIRTIKEEYNLKP